MLYEITVYFNSATSTLSFDGFPTYMQLRKAIASDIVGSDAFHLTGVTARGSVVPIKDASSLVRAIGPRHDLEVQVTQTLAAPQESQPRRSGSFRAERGGSPPPLNGAILGCTCEAVVSSLDGSTLAMCSVGSKLFVAERHARGAVSVRDSVSGALHRTIVPLDEADSATNCLCLLAVPKERHVRTKPEAGGAGAYAAEADEPSEFRIWAGFSTKRIAVIDTTSLNTVKTLLEHAGAVTSLCTASGFVFSASTDFTILQWNPVTYVPLKLMAKHSNAVRGLAAVGTKLVSCSDDRSAIVWNAATAEPMRQVQSAHSCGIRCVELHDRQVWTGADDGQICVWNFDSLRLEKTFLEHSGTVLALKALHHRVLSTANDRRICMFDAKALVFLGSLLHPHQSPPSSLALSATRQIFTFWTGGSEAKLCRWSLDEATALEHAPPSVQSASRDASPAASPPPSPRGLRFESASSGSLTKASFIKEQSDSAAVMRLGLEETSQRDVTEAQGEKRLCEILLLERVARDRFHVSADTLLRSSSKVYWTALESQSNSISECYGHMVSATTRLLADIAATSTKATPPASVNNSMQADGDTHSHDGVVLKAARCGAQ